MKSIFLVLNFFFFSFTSFCQINLDSVLVAYYNFDNNVIDQSANANNGTLQGTPTFLVGVNDNCLSFNGYNDYVELNNSLQLSNEFTISAWVKTTTTSQSFQTIIAKYETIYFGPYAFALHFNKLNMWLSTGNGSHVEFDSETTLEVDTWYHIIFMGSNGQGKFFIDCQLDNAIAAIPNLTQNDDIVTIGRQALYLGGGANYADWDGEIDELRVYNRVLTDDEISVLCKGETVTTTSLGTTKAINVFPNPTRDKLFIEISKKPTPSEFILSNNTGQIIYHTFASGDLMIDISTYPKGVYFLTINNEVDRVVKRVVIY